MSPPRQPAPAAERAFPPWSVAGSALGLVGIAQIGPLHFYTMSFLVDADPSVPGYAFRPRPFLTTMTVIAVLCGLGVGAAARARVVGEQGARQALLLSVVGLAVVLGVVLRYAGATG